MSGPRSTRVWISANSATVLRWSPAFTVRHRIDSTVPGRHRSTGSAPTQKHPAGEGHRDEHMRTFFAQVAHVLPVDDELLLVGNGEAVEQFAEAGPRGRREPRPHATDRGREGRLSHRAPAARSDPRLRRIACRAPAAALTSSEAAQRTPRLTRGA
jgi:hypothetical protein